MGLTAVVESFFYTSSDGKGAQVKCDLGAGEIVNAFYTSSAGDDSFLVPGDYVELEQDLDTGIHTVVGVVDTKNAQSCLVGEKRIYARNGAGEQVIEIFLKNDGSGYFRNKNGAMKLGSDGVFDINGFTIDTEGRATSPVQIVTPSAIVDNKEIAGHTHPAGGIKDSGGKSCSGNSGVNNG